MSPGGPWARRAAPPATSLAAIRRPRSGQPTFAARRFENGRAGLRGVQAGGVAALALDRLLDSQRGARLPSPSPKARLFLSPIF